MVRFAVGRRAQGAGGGACPPRGFERRLSRPLLSLSTQPPSAGAQGPTAEASAWHETTLHSGPPPGASASPPGASAPPPGTSAPAL